MLARCARTLKRTAGSTRWRWSGFWTQWRGWRRPARNRPLGQSDIIRRQTPTMAESFLLRDLPRDLQVWIGSGASERCQSQQEFVREALYEARANRMSTPSLPFESEDSAAAVTDRF